MSWDGDGAPDEGRRLSTDLTLFLKRVFPAGFFGFIALMAVLITMTEEGWDLLFFIVISSLLLVGFVVYRRMLAGLVDAVYDYGDSLVVRNRGQVTRVALADVLRVEASENWNPPRITLVLSKPCSLGHEIAFCPLEPFRHVFDADKEIAQALRVHAQRARTECESGGEGGH